MNRYLFFPLFDWLLARGLLSKDGTPRDYLVVIAATLIVYVTPILLVAGLIGWYYD